MPGAPLNVLGGISPHSPVGQARVAEPVEHERGPHGVVGGERLAIASGQGQVFPDQPGWAKLADGAYVDGPLLRRAVLTQPPALPQGGAPYEGNWIDVNLTLQEVTAYQGDSPVYWAPTSSGRPGWETPAGAFEIQRRVEKETMDSSTLLGKDAERADYKVENVRWAQYFTASGAALHENYWRDPALFGIPSSHGCLGLLPRDADWFWNWASVGTPVVVHQ